MKHPKELSILDYTYPLPEERIAAFPLAERDASKLLIYDQGTITTDTYRQLADYIPEDSLLVFNNTKVVEARLLFQKSTGGVIEVFCLEPHEQYADITSAMLQQPEKYTGNAWWEVRQNGNRDRYWRKGSVIMRMRSFYRLPI